MPDFPYLPPPVKGSSAWQPLVAFDDPTLPKLNNLRRAQAAGVRVPPTWWVFAAEIALVLNAPPPFSLAQYPLLVRCASPTEESSAASHSGRLLSTTAAEPVLCAEALLRIVNALPRDESGDPRGAVFVQPLLKAAEAGIARFDGFYYERTSERTSASKTPPLTHDPAHSEPQRGHYERGDIWCEWLKSVYNVFGADAGQPTQLETRLEIEYLRRGDRYTLLRLNRTSLPVPRNRTLRLYELRSDRGENSGAPLSPWTVAAVMAAGQEAMKFFSKCDPAVGSWKEPYVVANGERVWINQSVFLHLMDRWGLPRTLVTEAIGGESAKSEDNKADRRRLLFATPTLFRLELQSLRSLLSSSRKLAVLDSEIDTAQTLLELYAANVSAMKLAIQTKFALDCLRTGFHLLRRKSSVTATAQSVLHSIKDVCQPPNTVPEAVHARKPSLLRPSFQLDAHRQRFDDQMKLRWSMLREKILAEGQRLVEAGRLDAADDIFFLNPSQDPTPEFILSNSRSEPLDTIDFKQVVARNRQQYESVKAMSLPLSISEDALHRMTSSSIEVADDLNPEAK